LKMYLRLITDKTGYQTIRQNLPTENYESRLNRW
jgi:hypothetical protein